MNRYYLASVLARCGLRKLALSLSIIIRIFTSDREPYRIMKIANIEVCKPITQFVSFFIDKGMVIVESNISDYHFHEIMIKMKGNSSSAIHNVKVENISKPKPGVFCCKCHWSCVKIELICKDNLLSQL